MHEVERLSDGIAIQAHNRSIGEESPHRGCEAGTDYGAERSRNPFLEETYTLKAKDELVWCSWNGESHNLITRENYEYLRDSYLRYACLLGKDSRHSPAESIGVGIANLYAEMSSLLGDDMNVNLEERDGRLYFNLWKMHKWGDHTLYYFPIRFTEKLRPRLRRIVLTFYHEFMKANGLSTINDDDDAFWAQDILLDSCYCEDEDPSERRRRHRRVRSYESGGRVYKALATLESRSYYADLWKALERYPCADEMERNLIELIKKGMKFVSKEKSIMNYQYDPFYEEDSDFTPMQMWQQIRIVYDINGDVENEMADLFNLNSRETYELIPTSTFELTPDTDRVFVLEDDYPERFFEWADEFLCFINLTLCKQTN